MVKVYGFHGESYRNFMGIFDEIGSSGMKWDEIGSSKLWVSSHSVDHLFLSLHHGIWLGILRCVPQGWPKADDITKMDVSSLQFSVAGKWSTRILEMGMGQYLLIPFLVGWTSIYQLFCCSPGVQGFDPSPDDFSRKFHLVDLPATVDYQRLIGSVSKPCTPGEHQNSW